MPRPSSIQQINAGGSRTEKALKDIEAGYTVPEACRRNEISTSAVYKAIRRKQAEELKICPCCLQPVREQN